MPAAGGLARLGDAGWESREFAVRHVERHAHAPMAISKQGNQLKQAPAPLAPNAGSQHQSKTNSETNLTSKNHHSQKAI